MRSTPRPITQPDLNGWLFKSEVCDGCAAASVCGSQHSSLACPDDPPPATLRFQLHPRHRNVDRIIADLRTFDFPKRGHVVEDQGLPPYVPVVRPGNHAAWCVSDWVAVQLSNVLRRDGTTRSANSIRHSLRLNPSQRILLNCHVADHHLFTVWKYRARFARSVASSEFDCVLAPGYSVWATHYRLDQLIALSRSFEIFRLMHESGISAIPHVSGFTRDDWSRVGNWLSEHPEVGTVCVDLQRSRQDSAWAEEMAALRLLVASTDRSVKWVVCGVARPERLADVSEILGKFTAVNCDVYMRAVKGRNPWPALGGRSSLPKQAIYEQSLHEVSGFVQNLTNVVFGPDDRVLVRHRSVPKFIRGIRSLPAEPAFGR